MTDPRCSSLLVLLRCLPALAGVPASARRSPAPRRCWSPRRSRTPALAAAAWVGRPPDGARRLAGPRPLGSLVPGITSAALPGGGVLRRRLPRTRRPRARRGRRGGLPVPERARGRRSPAACSLFLAAMTLVVGEPALRPAVGRRSRRPPWPARRSIYFHRHHRSLEATWKYLLICSVGIALALLGNFFLAVAASAARASRSSLAALDDLAAGARGSNPRLAARPRSSSCWSATAPRWASRRCTPGCPTPTARRPRSSRRCSRARCSTARSWRSCALHSVLRGRGPGGVRRGPARASSACSRWASRRSSSSASATTSACWPTPASSTWASSRSASASAAPAASAPLLHAVNHSLTKAHAVPARRQHPRPRTARKSIAERARRAARAAASPARCGSPASSPSPARRRSGRS